MCDLAILGVSADPETTATINKLCNSACHVSIVKLEIRSLEALKLACQRLGLEFREGQETYAWFGRSVGDYPLPEGVHVDDLGKCSHEIKVPGAGYSIGVVEQGDHYALLWDSWGAGGLEAALGKDCNRLKQAYGISAALLEAQRQGFSVWEETLDSGAMKLHISVGG